MLQLQQVQVQVMGSSRSESKPERKQSPSHLDESYIWEFEHHYKMADSLVLWCEYSEHGPREDEDRWSTTSAGFHYANVISWFSSLASNLPLARVRELRGRKHPGLLTLSSSRGSAPPHCMTEGWYLGHGRSEDERKHAVCQLYEEPPSRANTLRHKGKSLHVCFLYIHWLISLRRRVSFSRETCFTHTQKTKLLQSTNIKSLVFYMKMREEWGKLSS